MRARIVSKVDDLISDVILSAYSYSSKSHFASIKRYLNVFPLFFSAVNVRAVGIRDADEPPLQHNAFRLRRQGLPSKAEMNMRRKKQAIFFAVTCG